MEHGEFTDRVLVKPESGHPGFRSYVLIGSAADLRALLEGLLAAVDRLERGPADYEVRFHGVQVGDATARYNSATLAVRVDPDLDKHRRRTRWFWHLYDSNLGCVVGLIVLGFAAYGLRTAFLALP